MGGGRSSVRLAGRRDAGWLSPGGLAQDWLWEEVWYGDVGAWVCVVNSSRALECVRERRGEREQSRAGRLAGSGWFGSRSSVKQAPPSRKEAKNSALPLSHAFAPKRPARNPREQGLGADAYIISPLPYAQAREAPVCSILPSLQIMPSRLSRYKC